MNYPSFWEAFKFWLKLGFISFGGPTGQIAIMHHELVDRRKWISEERFLHALNYCMLLPGPEAQQLAIYIGWLLHKTWGGIVAGSFFVIPSIFILTALSWIYMACGKIPAIASFFYGLKATVLAVITAAVIRIGQKVLKNEIMVLIAAFAFFGIFFLKIPFPLIIFFAGLIGFFGGKFFPKKFYIIKGGDTSPSKSVLADHDPTPEHAHPRLGRSVRVLFICLTLWIGPLIFLALWKGVDHLFFQQGLFFSKAAMVTFGGAYAVLPYIAQAGVETYHWLTAGQMIDGLGLAETTPGPLIMVVCFLGFAGGWQHASGLSPQVSGILGGLIATYFTFLPCFLWIFLGAPYIEKLRGNVTLSSALSTITAAVVGVVLNLAVYFGTRVLVMESGRLDLVSFAIAVLAFIGLTKFKWNLVLVVLGGAVVGLVLSYFKTPIF